MENHPAADLFPMMDESEYRKLVESIKAQGLIEPITLHEEMVLDGRNRMKACVDLGISPRFQEWDRSGGSPTMYAVAKNLNRRHLSKSQQATIAAEMLPLLRAEARARQVALAGTRPNSAADLPVVPPEGVRGEARAVAAKAVGVGESIVFKAARVKEVDAEEFGRIKSGETTVEEAYQKAVKKRDPPPPKPKRLETGRRLEMCVESNYERFTFAMGSISGGIEGISGLNMEYVVAGFSSGSAKEWAKKLDSFVSRLRNIKRQMETVSNGISRTDGSKEDSGEGVEDPPLRPAGAGPVEDQGNRARN